MLMEPTKKPKVKFFSTISGLKAEKMINEFLSQRESIEVKSIAMHNYGVMLLYEE